MREFMEKAQEISVARMLVKPALTEKIDAPAVQDFPEERIRFPELSRFFIEIRRDVFFVPGNGLGAFPVTEKGEKIFERRQEFERGDFEIEQKDVMPV